MECKKWNAKDTYRKASAEREPTTHLNTLGGQRPRADSTAYAHSAGPWLWLPVVLRGCVALVPNQVACCVVGLWGCGVCVCVLFAAWVPKSTKNLLRSPTSTKTEQKLDQNRQMRPISARGGKGQPKINENMKKYKKIKRKEAK